MVEEEKKDDYPKYVPIKKINPVNRLLLYLPTRHVKALKISLIMLFILIPILITMIVVCLLRKTDFKLIPLLIFIIGFSILLIILYIMGSYFNIRIFMYK